MYILIGIMGALLGVSVILHIGAACKQTEQQHIIEGYRDDTKSLRYDLKQRQAQLYKIQKEAAELKKQLPFKPAESKSATGKRPVRAIQRLNKPNEETTTKTGA